MKPYEWNRLQDLNQLILSTTSKRMDNKSRGRKELSVNATNVTKDVKCSMCKKGHALAKCKKFQELPSWRRHEEETQ